MTRSGRIIAGSALAAFLFASPAGAQSPIEGEGSMQVGKATVSVGGGTAMINLPDVEFMRQVVPAGLVRRLDDSKDFGNEIGWNGNASISLPIRANSRISVSGYWGHINDDDSTICTTTATAFCTFQGLVDSPASQSAILLGAGQQYLGSSDRDIDQWGVSGEFKWLIAPEVMGVTSAPSPRYLAAGVDVRAINQDTNLSYIAPAFAAISFNYNEDLDTNYYGAYLAWGGDYDPVLLQRLWSRWGMHSSFRLRGGVYYADTEYMGATVSNQANINSALSLSDNEISFIGGLEFETRKKIGARTTLTLNSTYEYFSYVPKMNYAVRDAVAGINGGQRSTVISSDDAFSARTTLSLTIKLGPDELFQ